jgi:hypothetical protein
MTLPGIADSVLRIAPTGSWFFDECRAWGLGRSDPASLAPTISAVPTLILAGTFDSSTAPAWVEQVTPGLSNSVVLHFPGIGHGVLPTSQCAQAIMTAYLDNPRAAVDSSCIEATTIPTFTTGSAAATLSRYFNAETRSTWNSPASDSASPRLCVDRSTIAADGARVVDVSPAR